MRGVITGKDVIANMGVVLSEFGVACLVRCLVAMARGSQSTFLDLAVKQSSR